MNPLHWFDTALLETVGWTLVHFLWQGTLVALALAAALAVLPSRRARARHGAAVVALVALVALPAITFLAMRQEGGALAPLAISTPTAPAAVPASVASTWPSEPSNPPLARTHLALRPFLPAIAFIWLLGVLLFSVRAVRAWLFARRLGQRGLESVPAAWDQRIRELARSLGLRRAVRVAGSRLAEVPMVAGWLRPILLVPVSCWTGLAPLQLEALLLHELAHIRRRDAWINALQLLVETVLFYHPGVWWVSGRLREERERCCDDLAVASGGNALTYARSLLELETLRRPSATLVLAADGSAGRGELQARIRRLLETPARPRALGWVACLALVGVVLFGLSCWRVSAAPPILDGPTTEGTWKARLEKDGARMELNLRYRSTPSGLSIHGTQYELRAFEGLAGSDLGQGSREVQFQLRRDAGTLDFAGRFEHGKGTGTFRFSPSESYADALEALGLERPPFVIQMQLALHNLELERVRAFDAAGYHRLSYDDHISMLIHDVSLDFVQGLVERGYPRPSVEDLVSMRIHGVSLELIGQLATMGYAKLSIDRLVSMQIHGVSPALLSELAALGYEHPDVEDVVSLKIHGFTPEWLHELGALGYRKVPIEDLVSMRIHGVTPAFIGEIEALGYDDLDAQTLINFKINGVTPELIRAELEKRRQPPTPEDLIEDKIMGRLGS